MTKDTRSSCKIKDVGNNTSKKRLVNVKGSSTLGSATTDSSGLRRSSRETSSRKQMISGPSSTHKSEQLEKWTPNTPLKKKSEKYRIPSSLRRSERTKKHLSLSSSGSKKSEKGSASSDLKLNKLKRVKNVKQLTLAAKEVSRNEKQDLKPVGLKKKRMQACKALFKPQRTRITLQDTDGELEKPDKLSQVGSSIVRGSASKQVEDGGDECSERTEVELAEDYVERTCGGATERTSFSLKNSDTVTSGDHNEAELSFSSQKHSCTEEPCEPSDGDGLNASKSDGTGKETLDCSRRIQVDVDLSATKKLQTPVLVDSTLIGRSLGRSVHLGTGNMIIPYKRKRDTLNVDSNASKLVANKDICASIVDAISSPSFGCKRLNNSIDPAALKAGLEEREVAGDKGGASEIPSSNGSQSVTSSTVYATETLSTNHDSASPFSSGNISLVPGVQMVQSKERTPREDQKSLHHLLKPDMSKLCEILQLSEDVKVMVGSFLDYIIDNHHVSREPLTILQAFEICVCWIAASLLKHKIDRKKSLALAKQHLNFGCKEEEANNVYSKLWLLRKMFLYRKENLKETYSLKETVSAAEDIMKATLDARLSVPIQNNVKWEDNERSHNQEFSYEHVLSQQGQAPKDKMAENKISKSIEQIKKKCEKQMTKLIQKQQEEIREFYRIWEEEKLQLEKKHWFESDLVRNIHSSRIPVRVEKLNILDNDFAKKLEEHKREKDIHLKDLGAKQLAERNERRQKAAYWLAKVKSMVQGEVLGELPSHGSDFGDMVGHSQASEHTGLSKPGNIASKSGHLPEERSPDRDFNGMQASGVASSGVSKTAPSEAVVYNIPIKSLTLPVNRNCENAMDAIASDRISDGFEQPNGRYSQSVQVEGSQISISTGTHSGDALASANENIVLQVEVPTSHSRTDFEAPIIESVELQSSPSINLPLGHNQPDLLLVHEVDNHERHTSLQNADATDLPSGLNQLDLSSSAGVNHQANVEGCTYRNTDIQPQLIEGTAELPYQAVLQPGGNLGLHLLTDIPIAGSGAHLPMHTAPHVASQLPVLPFDADPLQNELERLRKETEEANKVHEELKLQLRSECEKEIEEIIVQIHRKYEAKLQDTDAAFLLKKVELDGNHNKVLMNKILAEAFRSVCPADLRPSGAFGMQQVMPSSFMHQLQQLSLHPVPRPFLVTGSPSVGAPAAPPIEAVHHSLSHPVPRPSPVTGSSSVDPPGSTHQTAIPPIQVVHSSSHPLPRPSPITSSSSVDPRATTHQTAVPPTQVVHHSSSHPVPRPSLVTGSSSVGQRAATYQTAVPPIQVVHYSSVLLSSTATRPPHISPITPPTGNPPIIGRFRAPAPHIQPFRPSTSISTNISSLPCGMPNHQAVSNMPTTSCSVPQLPPQPPPLLPLPPLTYNSGPCTQNAGGFPSLHNSSSSALELCMDANNRPGAPTLNVLPQQHLDSNFNSLDLPKLKTMGNVGINLAHLGVATDVVCLSDDD